MQTAARSTPTIRFEPFKIGAAVLLVAYVLLAIAYSTNVPIYEAPDEPGHFDYVMHIARNGTLPLQSTTERNYAHHPPLYYALAAIPVGLLHPIDSEAMPRLKDDFVWPGKNGAAIAEHRTAETFPYSGAPLALHLARLVSIAFGTITVGATLAIAQFIFPDHKGRGLLAAALVAFNPQFLFISGTVNNDTAVAALCACTLFQLLRAANEPHNSRQWLLLGSLTALAVLAKSSAVILCAAIGVAWLITLVMSKQRTSMLVCGAACIGAFLLISGWWFLRNLLHYGDLLGWQTYRQAWNINLRSRPFSVDELPSFFSTQFRSYWGVFGWMNVYAESWFYTLVTALSVAGLLLLFVGIAFGRLRALTKLQKAGLVILALHLITLQLFVLFQYSNHNESLSQGRYLFPAIASIALLLGAGLLAIMPRRAEMPVAVGASSAMLFVATTLLVQVIVPAYPSVTISKLAALTLPNRMDLPFGGKLAMRGFDWTIKPADGNSVELNVLQYWQAKDHVDFDYSVFVHVIDSTDQVIAQHDQAPGTSIGRKPTLWKKEDTMPDTWTMRIPASTAIAGLRLRVGVYNASTGQRLTDPHGNDSVTLTLK